MKLSMMSLLLVLTPVLAGCDVNVRNTPDVKIANQPIDVNVKTAPALASNPKLGFWNNLNFKKVESKSNKLDVPHGSRADLNAVCIETLYADGCDLVIQTDNTNYITVKEGEVLHVGLYSRNPIEVLRTKESIDKGKSGSMTISGYYYHEGP